MSLKSSVIHVMTTKNEKQEGLTDAQIAHVKVEQSGVERKYGVIDDPNAECLLTAIYAYVQGSPANEVALRRLHLHSPFENIPGLFKLVTLQAHSVVHCDMVDLRRATEMEGEIGGAGDDRKNSIGESSLAIGRALVGAVRSAATNTVVESCQASTRTESVRDLEGDATVYLHNQRHVRRWSVSRFDETDTHLAETLHVGHLLDNSRLDIGKTLIIRDGQSQVLARRYTNARCVCDTGFGNGDSVGIFRDFQDGGERGGGHHNKNAEGKGPRVQLVMRIDGKLVSNDDSVRLAHVQFIGSVLPLADLIYRTAGSGRFGIKQNPGLVEALALRLLAVRTAPVSTLSVSD